MLLTLRGMVHDSAAKGYRNRSDAYEDARPAYPPALRDRLASLQLGIELLAGTAEAIPLDDQSVDAVAAAQAFHWFRADRAQRAAGLAEKVTAADVVDR